MAAPGRRAQECLEQEAGSTASLRRIGCSTSHSTGWKTLPSQPSSLRLCMLHAMHGDAPQGGGASKAQHVMAAAGHRVPDQGAPRSQTIIHLFGLQNMAPGLLAAALSSKLAGDHDLKKPEQQRYGLDPIAFPCLQQPGNVAAPPPDGPPAAALPALGSASPHIRLAPSVSTMHAIRASGAP